MFIKSVHMFTVGNASMLGKMEEFLVPMGWTSLLVLLDVLLW